MTDTPIAPETARMVQRITTEGHRLISQESARTAIHGLRALNTLMRMSEPDTDYDLLRRIRVALHELGATK